MSTPLITVLIDTYNYGRFIEECVQSVLAQDFPMERVEVLVVDDGSTDDTAQRLKKYAPKIQHFYQPNRGQAAALNLGLQKAKGEIVVLLDADDYWLPGKLRRVTEEFAKHPDVGMVYHRMLDYDMRTGEQQDASFVAISGFVPADRKKLLCYILYPTSALAFRRRHLDASLPIPEALKIQADAHLTGLIIFVAPIVAIPESLAVYRIHGENLYYTSRPAGVSLQRAQRRIASRDALVKGMKAWLEAHGHDPKERNIRTFLMQWTLAQEEDEFSAHPPGRLRFFLHLWRYNYYFSARLTRRHVLVNYLNAFGALLVGFTHFYLLDRWRLKIKDFIRRSRRPSAGPQAARG